MTAAATVGGRQVLDGLEALRATGADVEALCRTIGLDVAAIGDDTTRVPGSQLAALFAEAERQTGDPLVGLHAGEHAEPRGALAYFLLSSPRLDEGIRQAMRFIGVAISTARAGVEEDADTFSIVYRLGDATLTAQ